MSEKELKISDKCKKQDVPIGHYFTDAIHVWQSVRSGDVMGSFAPNFPIMKCVEIYNKYRIEYKIGDVVEDYFSHDFMYLGDDFEIIKKWLKVVKADIDKEHGGKNDNDK